MSRCRTILLGHSAQSACVLLFLVSALALHVAAQSRGDSMNGQGSLRDQLGTARSFSTAPNTGVLIFTVSAERSGHSLDRQALLKLVNLATQASVWQTTDSASQGPYDQSGSLGVFTDIPYGHYDVEVSAVGYLSTHKDVNVARSQVQQQIDIVLHRDPDAVNLDFADSVLPPKIRKETRHAVSALKSGKFPEAQKQLDLAYKSAPTSPDLNFLLGYLYFQLGDFGQAENYLGTATHLDPRNVQAVTLLGRTELLLLDYPAARSALEKAALADSENWLPHSLLADAYLHEKDYAKARDEAEIAIAKGKTAAASAKLVLGQALINLGKNQQGIEVLNDFLKESPQQPIAGQVRDLIAQIQTEIAQVKLTPIQDQASASDSPDDALPPSAPLSSVDPLLALSAPRLSIKPWQPPDIDDVKLSLAPDVVCPSQQVAEESGKRVQELVDDVARFAAVENLYHQSLDQFGVPIRSETRKYNYVASISEPQPGFLAVDEYRADTLASAEYPDHIASTGFAALALVFHPDMRDNFAMDCEGLGDWHGQATWLVHFSQRKDRPSRMHGYKIGNQMFPVDLKGRAWITADKFQIVRIESDMINPMPEIRLLSEHEVVEYGPIPFASKNTSLWLPKSAEIYFDFRKHRYYRRHSFDHYMLYSVDTEEHRKEPVVKPATEPDDLDKKNPS